MDTQKLAKEEPNGPKKNGMAKNNIPGKNMGRRALSILIKIALLSAISFGLRLLEFPLGFLFPPFLKMDFSDIPAILGSFAFGPWGGIIIAGIKNLLVLAAGMSTTGGVGELANFLLSVALVLPGSIYYYWKKNRGTAILSLSVGIIFMVIASGILNLYLLIPVYSKFMPIEQIIALCKAVNPAINSVETYILYAAMPFTLIKGVVQALVTYLIYKRMSKVLHM